jgi:23S rRNA pseudouridine1911/1915/1917 synthase
MRLSRGLAPEALAAFDSWQWPAERKLTACDLLVDNDAGLDELDLRARELLATLEKLRRERSGHFQSRLDALLNAVAGETLDMPEADIEESEFDWEEDET